MIRVFFFFFFLGIRALSRGWPFPFLEDMHGFPGKLFHSACPVEGEQVSGIDVGRWACTRRVQGIGQSPRFCQGRSGPCHSDLDSIHSPSNSFPRMRMHGTLAANAVPPPPSSMK
ncbi:hypothetical protein IE53DRAFT_41741 [Violaceomyces palustris]|uniref:Uncharacterized protein n=1 Tax=Violaceomyces palustris TaxID=1673888 RepID=A0ACD0P0S5_9BASI|nr:hypothetical protein IE53DRAFT_41741 [Violaceomyces palustris]